MKKNKVKNKIDNLIKILDKRELRILPGQLAFFLVLSVIPIITLTTFFATEFAIDTDSLVDFISKAIPSELSKILIPYINVKGFDLGVGVWMVTGFLVASNGAHSIIISSNALYGIDDSPYLNRRIKAILMTILLVLLFIFILIILAFGNSILNFIFSLGFLKQFSKIIYMVYFILKWSVALFIIFFLLKLIYTMAPDMNLKSKSVNKGAIFATLSFSIITAVYSYYVTYFSNYDIIYGSLTGIVLLMIYIYILSVIFVIGIAINSNSYKLENQL